MYPKVFLAFLNNWNKILQMTTSVFLQILILYHTRFCTVQMFPEIHPNRTLFLEVNRPMCEANPPLSSRIENENPWKSVSTVPETFMPELFITPKDNYTFVRTRSLEIVLFCVCVPNQCWQHVLHIHSRLRTQEYGNGVLESVRGKQKLNYSHKPRQQSDYCKVCSTFTNGQILLSVHGSTYSSVTFCFLFMEVLTVP